MGLGRRINCAEAGRGGRGDEGQASPTLPAVIGVLGGRDPGKVLAVKKPTKSEFIRAQPAELMASEVVKKARAQGISLSTQLVYVTRSVARRKQLGAVNGSLGSAFSTSARGRGRASADVSAKRFLALVTDIGLSRAEKLLVKFKSDVASIDLR